MDDAAVLEAMARIKKVRNRRPGDVNPTRIQVSYPDVVRQPNDLNFGTLMQVNSPPMEPRTQSCNARVPHTYDSQGIVRYVSPRNLFVPHHIRLFSISRALILHLVAP